MSTVQVVTTYVVCPHCEQRGSSIDHLIADHQDRSWGPWYCDHCGGGYQGAVTADGAVSVEKAKRGESFTKCFDLLRIPPQQHAVYIVRSASHPTGREHEGTQYYYESHSCPTNWLSDLEMISVEGDQDPHGLIEYVGTAPFDQKIVDDCNHDWSETFPVIAESSGQPQGVKP